jgi:hypothetical protein
MVQMDSWSGAASTKNRDNVMRKSIIRALSPQDIAGTAFLTWRYRDEEEDLNLAYVPAIRRSRRMSPANRSDAFLGSDLTMDDAGGFEAKIMSFDWKFLKKTEVLSPYHSVVPGRIVKGDEGEWKVGALSERVVAGYAQKDWQGAPWAPVDAVWVKRPAYLVESFPKDPYYNSGKTLYWFDAEMSNVIYKVIYDRSGKYWKTLAMVFGYYENEDKEMKSMAYPMHYIYDARRDHATVFHIYTKRDPCAHYVPMDENDYSLAGFQKYCR